MPSTPKAGDSAKLSGSLAEATTTRKSEELGAPACTVQEKEPVLGTTASGMPKPDCSVAPSPPRGMKRSSMEPPGGPPLQLSPSALPARASTPAMPAVDSAMGGSGGLQVWAYHDPAAQVPEEGPDGDPRAHVPVAAHQPQGVWPSAAMQDAQEA